MGDTRMRRLSSAATPPPWKALTEPATGGAYVTHPNKEGEGGSLVCIMPNTDALPTTRQDHANLDFVAASRRWVDTTLDKHRKIRELHQPVIRNYFGGNVEECSNCYGYPHPCPTLQLLDEEPNE